MNNTIHVNTNDTLFYSDFISSKSSEKGINPLLDKLRKIDTINLSKGPLRFSDNFWDFSIYTDLNIPARKLQFKFDTIPYEFIDDAKFFILSEVLKNTSKIQSVHRKFGDIKSFLIYLYDSNIFTIDSITFDNIKNYVDILNENYAPTTVKNTKTYLKQFLYFLSQSFNLNFDDRIFKLLEDNNLQYLKSYTENNKYEDIPDKYFNNLLSLCISIMDDDNEPNDDRILTALIVLLSQTGIRQSDLLDMKINSLYKESILNGEKEAYYLRYADFKKEKGNNSYTIENVFLNELSVKAYNLLVDLCHDNRTKLKSDVLSVPSKQKSVPVCDSHLSKRLYRFSLKHRNKLNNINNKNLESLAQITIQSLVKNYSYSKSSYEGLNLTDVISVPRAHQFRVHLCTQLYRKGVPLAIIQKHMTHLTSDMQDYYIRKEDDSKKELEYSKSVLKTVLKDEASLIGGNKDALMKKINQFIDKGKFNVEKDIDTIVDSLSKKIPIKEKLGGICIKSGPKRDCSKDAMTDEFYCAYGICPNHFHLYTMIDITYSRYTNLIKTMNFNKEKGFLRQSEKEKFKLICVVRDSLIPELKELQKEIAKHGAETITVKHPNLEYFVTNFDTVYKEVSQWLN